MNKPPPFISILDDINKFTQYNINAYNNYDTNKILIEKYTSLLQVFEEQIIKSKNEIDKSVIINTKVLLKRMRSTIKNKNFRQLTISLHKLNYLYNSY
jgi:hypothetical protein